MAGIYGAFLKEKSLDLFNKFMSNNPVVDEYKVKGGLVGRSTIDKLQNDRFFKTKNNVTICFEGVNLSDDIHSYEDFFNAYQNDGINFISALKGNYSGFILDEASQKIYVFNDHLSTKNIFFFYKKEIGLVFSSELKSITGFFKSESISYSLNTDAVYMMALYGFLLEDHTYVKEIKKLPYSSVVSYDIKSGEMNVSKTFSYSNQSEEITLQDATHHINELMEKSVSKNWSKDLGYGSKHLSLLSGGMDARTNAMIAKKLGFKNISTLTFGVSNSQDVEYAAQIAKGEGFNHFTRFLDTPSYLIDNILENYIKPNDGLMMYHTSAHTSSTVRTFNFNEVGGYSTLHTGQIGDVLFGSFSNVGFDFIKNRGTIGYTGNISDLKMLDKIESLNNILEKYQHLGAEIYSYEQRQLNATIFGDRSLNDVVDNLSPFYDLVLIKFCLSLPPEFKKNQMIYFHWLKSYHPEILNYPWEKIQMCPNSEFKMKYGRLYKKYFNGAKKYFRLNYDSMNPYETWIKKFPFILKELDTIVETEINNPILDKEIQKDLKNIYQKNIFEYRNKFAVVTALLAVKLHFGNDG